MIFADKLILLRKRAGWSQEELAEQMDVTRQSVSKWEGAQSVPDLEKMIRLSDLFGVSTDYLLKDEIEDIQFTEANDNAPCVRHVSMEEANKFLSVKERTAKITAYAVFLCIISPVCLIILGALSETPNFGLNENVAAGVGMIVLLALVAAAVCIFVFCGSLTSPFLYLDSERFETEYGVRALVEQRKRNYKKTYDRSNIIGTFLCIASIIPIFVGVIIDEHNDLLIVIMLALLFVSVGVGVIFFVKSGIIWASFERLLQEDEYSIEKKEKNPIASVIYTVYWVAATALFLALSFVWNRWTYSGLVWVFAGVLFPAVVAITNAVLNKEK